MIRWILVLLVLASPLVAQSSADLRAGFTGLALANPQHVKLTPLSDSDAYAVVLHDQAVTETRPALLIVGSLRGDEIAPATACLELAKSILADDDARKQLTNVQLIIIPTPNPAARDLRFAAKPNAVPGVLRPHDDDRDGLTDEDGPSDLNGDGQISQMRLKRAGGRYIASRLDPRILIEAKPGQTGEWDLLWEGQDDDGDGHINEDAIGTVTLSNDWSVRWSKKQQGANRMMMQLSQTRALVDFIAPRRNIVAALQIRSIGDGLEFASGPKVKAEDPFERDKELQETLGKLWKNAAGESPKGALKSAAVGDGNILDWLYEAQGVYAANLSLHTMVGPKPEKKEEKKESEDDGEEKAPEPKKDKPSDFELSEQAWLKYSPEGYLEWKTFKHPQLGEVEIGGWKVTARHDPKTEDVTAGAGKAATFVKSLLGGLPKLEVSKVEVESKGSGLYRVRLTLRNAGSLDYRTAFSKVNRIHLPLFVSVTDSKDVALISGTRRLSAESINADGAATFEWLVRTSDKASELNFSIESKRLGDLSHKVAIKNCPSIKTEDE
ncbi:MAG: M14 family metallopeptidase [Planctomycetota bacterium]|jgi:hypothetical protein